VIRINLLPWREARRKAQRQHLGVLGGMVAVLGLLIVGAVHLTIAGYIAVQSDRNEFLKRENVRLDKEIEEIKKLKAVYMLQELVQQVPDGVYLKAIKQTGLKINMVGYAQSNARVSTLMRNFAASPYLENPDLVEIKAVLVSNKRVSEFIMNVSLKQVQSEDAGKSGKAAPKAAPAKG